MTGTRVPWAFPATLCDGPCLAGGVQNVLCHSAQLMRAARLVPYGFQGKLAGNVRFIQTSGEAFWRLVVCPAG